uniref:NADH:ubiquinone reductase (H(+)-translocating) n=1 Tax=Linguatula serrata TaxID=646052 RepID=A0A385UHQ6_9CRUS|nr:NADH dehydrogenase subunit 5 [Linguatula serrata]AYB71161.1 NADH dehydrogenase subunit 5 [Linguatula serrata]
MILGSGVSWVVEYVMFSVGGVEWSVVFLCDVVSLMFAVYVMIITVGVFVYSGVYVSSGSVRFYFLVFSFVVSMLLMVMSPSMVSIILGWDGLGVVSYFLVVFYGGSSVDYSGMITFLSNRLGDSVLMVSVGWLMCLTSWNFLMWDEWVVWFFVMILLMGMTKSAQFPFSAWLPEAMAAPTPVSALVHSSTLVTAGVYLVMRYSVNEGCSWLVYVGLFTMLIFGAMALWEVDGKKVIAFSTLSQLGMMFMCLGLGLKILVFFHLLTHALFKSLLFLCMGVVIYKGGGSQDVRMMGGSASSGVVVGGVMVVSVMSLVGFPYLSGFYSKDYMMEWVWGSMQGGVVEALIFSGLCLTVAYGVRLVKMVMLGEWGGEVMSDEGGLSNMFLFPLVGLGGLVVFSGSWMVWVLFEGSVVVSIVDKVLPLISLVVGSGMMVMLNGVVPEFLMGVWKLSGSGVGKLGLEVAGMYRVLDEGWLVYGGFVAGEVVKSVSSGVVKYYGVSSHYFMILFFMWMGIVWVMYI